MGRRPSGAGLVAGLDGGTDEKHRLTVILRTLTGELTIDGACAALGVSASRFHDLRQAALAGALAALAPRPAGRRHPGRTARTSRTFCASPRGVKGLERKAIPAPSTPWRTMASSV